MEYLPDVWRICTLVTGVVCGGIFIYFVYSGILLLISPIAKFIPQTPKWNKVIWFLSVSIVPFMMFVDKLEEIVIRRR